MKTQIVEKVCLFFAATALSSTAFAQSGGGFDLMWSTIDSGGGTSTGGVYTVSGTIGQPDAGWPVDQNGFPIRSTGGSYTVIGGFWSVIPQEGAPMLAINVRGTNLVLSWPVDQKGFVVQSATQLAPAVPDWSTLAGTPVRVGDKFELVIGLANTPPDPIRFFRLYRQ